jgi:hypothetical protein
MAMGDQIPAPPIQMVMPATGQVVFTAIWAAVVLGFAGYAARELLVRRTPLPLVLLAAGAVCYFNEPIDDVLGLVWHPRPGQWVALDTLSPVPVWGVFVYMALFGGIPYLMFQAFQRGVTAKQIWTWIGVFWVADIAVEIPALHFGMYDYFGNPPFEVAGLPLYWFAINIGGPLETALILFVGAQFFRGWRMLLVLPLPMILDAAGSVGAGWPVFSALHAQASTPVKYLAALGTLAIAGALLKLTVEYAARRSQEHATAGRVGAIAVDRRGATSGTAPAAQ